MLKMIIVDDEKIIRETIHSLIDWNSLGIDVAAVCKDGIEAFDCILDEYPDIVMTDIKMPGLSGLDLIEKVRAAQLNTEFIILSGYGEFEFARTAMRYGVKHYLLKPSNETEITQVIVSCVEKVIKYIGEHLSDSNLSLKWISENYLFMNPDYVSKMFVKQTGSKFSAYVTELRIQEAKKLLLEHSEESPYAVAVMVGFGNNPQYFSQIFKKYTKLSPKDYVKSMLEP